MKKNILVVVICLVLVCLFTTIYHIEKVGADSGFDSSYDSGGSFDSGSDWSSSDYSSSGSSGDISITSILIFAFVFWSYMGLILMKINGNSSKKFLIIYVLILFLIISLQAICSSELIEFIVCLIIEFIISLFLRIYSKKTTKTTSDFISNRNEIDKLENKQEILNNAFNIYKELQISWMNFDYDKIKELVSDEMYNMYSNQLETLKVKNQINIMENIKYVNGSICNYNKLNNKEIYVIRMKVTCRDYIINTINNKVERGNKSRLMRYTYILTFEANIEEVDKCQRCGADVKDLTECPYCKSKIVNNTSKLVMTKKQMINQR